MAAAEQRSEFKFVFLQRINLKSNYKRRFKSLAEDKTIEIYKKSSSENSIDQIRS